jgi:hypothetical protein
MSKLSSAIACYCQIYILKIYTQTAVNYIQHEYIQAFQPKFPRLVSNTHYWNSAKPKQIWNLLVKKYTQEEYE